MTVWLFLDFSKNHFLYQMCILIFVKQTITKDNMDNQMKQVKAELAALIGQSKGKVFMGMVHHMYGPLRGLNFILDNAQVEEIISSIDEQAVEMEAEEQMKLVQELKDGKEPGNIIELVFKIWSETGLSPRLMVLPNELIEQAENPPIEVKDIREGRNEILKAFRMTYPLQEKDPHFFRVGIV